MRAIIALLVFVAVVGVGLSRHIGDFMKPGPSSASATTTATREPASQRQTQQRQPQQTSTGRTVTLQGDGRGHFQVEARIDGRRLEAIVDTGASLVVLNERSANSLGIFPRASEFTGRTNTANGVAKYAPVRLNRLEINGIAVRDVEAAVMKDEALKVNLLGMSFLAKVKFTHDRGRLVLEQ